MPTASFAERLHRIEHYFDRTALDAWKQLTSDQPVSRIRATVRAGRDRMRSLLLDALPQDLAGQRVLDAGCGTGALAIEAARRGATVLAVDISAGLIEVARNRAGAEACASRITFMAGDMLAPALGEFDHAVCMDSLIHYETPDMVRAVASLSARVRETVAFTFAPRTPALALMHWVGRAFPRGDRAPAIVPAAERVLRRQIAELPALSSWRIAQSERITSGFYMSQAMVLRRQTLSRGNR
jgi:magnesium-protoporphyrin O-methyltransferase